MAIAEETLAAARAHGNPFWIAFALARVRAGLRPDRSGPSPATSCARGSPTPRSTDSRSLRRLSPENAAGLEAVHGDPEQALALFDTALDSLHRAGNVASLAIDARQPGRVLRPLRPTRRRRHPLRRQHQPGRQSVCRRPPRSGGPPARRARRRRVRPVRRHRGRHGPRPTPSATPDTRSNSPAAKPPTPTPAAHNRHRTPPSSPRASANIRSAPCALLSGSARHGAIMPPVAGDPGLCRCVDYADQADSGGRLACSADVCVRKSSAYLLRRTKFWQLAMCRSAVRQPRNLLLWDSGLPLQISEPEGGNNPRCMTTDYAELVASMPSDGGPFPMILNIICTST